MASVGFKPGNMFVYRYAVFLAETYGEGRQEDIRQLVSIFTPQNQSDIVPAIPEVISMTRLEPALERGKRALLAVARVAPTFKTYLLSLGWDESDFANN